MSKIFFIDSITAEELKSTTIGALLAELAENIKAYVDVTARDVRRETATNFVESDARNDRVAAAVHTLSEACETYSTKLGRRITNLEHTDMLSFDRDMQLLRRVIMLETLADIQRTRRVDALDVINSTVDNIFDGIKHLGRFARKSFAKP